MSHVSIFASSIRDLAPSVLINGLHWRDIVVRECGRIFECLLSMTVAGDVAIMHGRHQLPLLFTTPSVLRMVPIWALRGLAFRSRSIVLFTILADNFVSS